MQTGVGDLKGSILPPIKYSTKCGFKKIHAKNSRKTFIYDVNSQINCKNTSTFHCSMGLYGCSERQGVPEPDGQWENYFEQKLRTAHNLSHRVHVALQIFKRLGSTLTPKFIMFQISLFKICILSYSTLVKYTNSISRLQWETAERSSTHVYCWNLSNKSLQEKATKDFKLLHGSHEEPDKRD